MNTMKQNRKLLSVALAVCMLTMALAGCGGTATNQTVPPDTQPVTAPATQPTPEATDPITEPAPTDAGDTEPTVPPVELSMPEYSLSYGGTMADVISWQEQTDPVGLQFYVDLSDGTYPIFTMLLNQAQGDTVHVKKNSTGEEVFITFLMEAVPEGMSAEDEQVFCMAQDIVNDIVDSLILK